jgi:Tfp pilus assembly protein PilO
MYLPWIAILLVGYFVYQKGKSDGYREEKSEEEEINDL